MKLHCLAIATVTAIATNNVSAAFLRGTVATSDNVIATDTYSKVEDSLDDPRRDGVNLLLSKVDYGEDWGEDDEDDKEPSAPDKEDPGSLALFKDVQGVNTRGDALQDKKNKRTNLSLSKVEYGEDDEDDKEPSAPDKEDPGSLALFKDVQGVNTRGDALQDKKNKRTNLSLSKVDVQDVKKSPDDKQGQATTGKKAPKMTE